MSNTAAMHDAPTVCENCATPLKGGFCHECGQSAHNPLRHAGHAIEEVFESFWHLDGRIFRTLRSLWSPGQLAISYLAGHRAPYVAPLRLFVILSVLTFFVAQYTVHFGNGETDAGTQGDDSSLVRGDFDKLATVADVEQQRDQAVCGLLRARSTVGYLPGFDRSIRALHKQARARIAQLDPRHPSLQQPLPERLEVADVPGCELTEAEAEAEAASEAARIAAATGTRASASSGFMERWLAKKSQRAEENWDRFIKDPELLKNAIMRSIPTALFFMVPIFALFLKLAYVETPRLYLEHLVVALYSHAWLCLALLAICLLVALDNWIAPHAGWFGGVAGVLEFVIGWWMPIYLLLMQKRVYRQAWWLTILKYLVIGFVYIVLVTFAAAFVAISSFVSG